MQAAATSENEEIFLQDRRLWLNLMQQVEKMSNTSSFCKQLLNTIQNVVLGKICAKEETVPPINISYKDIQNSEYLKKALFESWGTTDEGVIRIDLDQVYEIREYLENKENLKNTTDLSQLIYYYKSASFLADDKEEEKILLLLDKQIENLPLEDVCELFRSLPFHKIQQLLESRISALVPKRSSQVILKFFYGYVKI